MLLRDLISETYSALVANKTRSALTVLGIVIGIGSVIAMIAIGKGAQVSVEERIQSIGANLLMVRPGASGQRFNPVSSGQGTAVTLTMEDAEAIAKGVSTVEAVAPESSSREQVLARGTNTNTSIYGVTPDYASVRNVQVAEGSFLSDQNLSGMAKVAVLGPDTVTELFGEGAEAVGQKIRIGSVEFTIIGETVSKGGTGFGSSDDVIYIPITTLQQFFTGSDSLDMINVEVANQDEMTDAENAITALLLERHGIADSSSADFRIMNQGDIVETASSVTGTFTILLGAVAGISLVVGGIGIMNMMLTTVTERTREIGLRKAIGAKRADITKQFLLEAVSLTLIGGILGTGLGWLVAWGVEQYAGQTTEVTLFSILLAFGVSSLIGIVFGYYPARRAARLDPMKALRYE